MGVPAFREATEMSVPLVWKGPRGPIPHVFGSWGWSVREVLHAFRPADLGCCFSVRLQLWTDGRTGQTEEPLPRASCIASHLFACSCHF